MKKQAGFTLIELIMVIVILGILSAFALPRFADLSGSAETAALEGARASVASSSAIVHAASLVAGNSSLAAATVLVEGGNANIIYGYPALAVASDLNLDDVAQITDFSVIVNGTTTTEAFIYSNFNDGKSCFVYTEATATTAPAIVGAMGTIVESVTVDGVFDIGETCAGVARD